MSVGNVGLERFPARKPPRGPRRPPGIKPPAPVVKKAEPEGPLGGKAVKKKPFFVPAGKGEAWSSTLINVAVLGILALFLYYLYMLWLPEALPSQVMYFLILVATVLTVLFFLVSLFVYVLPRLLGLRGPPA
jgi:hypothetical protein